MKVKIRDEINLKTITPEQLVGYLQLKGWHQERKISDKGAVWTLELQSGEEFELLVPLTQDIRDYRARIIDALNALEVIEERSLSEIFHDLRSFPTGNNLDN